jgi:maltose-binding protein MalE
MRRKLQNLDRRQQMISVAIAVLILIIIILFVRANWGDDNNADTRSNYADRLPTQPPTPVIPQRITLWHSLDEPARNTLITLQVAFEDAHPNIEMTVEYIAPDDLQSAYELAVNQGRGPTLLIAPPHWLPDLANAGMIETISPDLFEVVTGAEYLTEPMVTATELANQPDIMYGVPFTGEFATLYYNQVLVPNPPEMYANLKQQAATYDLLIAPTFMTTSGLYLSRDGALLAPDGSNLVTQTALEDYLAEIKALVASPGVTFTTNYDPFTAGEAGLLLASSQDYAMLRAALGDDLAVVSLPRIPPARWQTLVEFQVIMQNLNNTIEAAAAGDIFIAYLLSPDIQRQWFVDTNDTPLNVMGLDAGNLRQAWGSALSKGIAAPLDNRYHTTLRPALDAAIQQVLDGETPVDVAAATLNTLGQD